MYKSILAYATTIVTLLLLTGCGSDSTGPDKQAKTIKVQVFTTGQHKDADHYTVKAGGETAGTTEAEPNRSNGREGSMEIMEFQLTEPSTDVELTGVSNRCEVQGENPRTVSSRAEQTGPVIFEVHCEPSIAELPAWWECFYSHGQWWPCKTYAEALPNPAIDPVIVTDGSGLSQPSESFDSTTVAFGIANNIWTMNTDGSEAKQLTDSGKDHSPSYCPDGSLFFTSQRDGRSQLYWKGKKDKPVRIETEQPLYEVTCNPDENSTYEAAVRVGSGAEASIGLINVDTTKGKRLTILTQNDYYEAQPAWTPDGKSLVCVIMKKKGRLNLATISAENGKIQEQSDFKPGYLDKYANPSVSPDGKWIVFTSVDQASPSSDYNASRSNRTYDNGIIDLNLGGGDTDDGGGYSIPPLVTY